MARGVGEEVGGFQRSLGRGGKEHHRDRGGGERGGGGISKKRGDGR